MRFLLSHGWLARRFNRQNEGAALPVQSSESSESSELGQWRWGAIFTLVLLPVAASLGGGAWLVLEANALREGETQQVQGSENFSQAKALADSFFDGIHLIRSEALALQQLRAAQAQARTGLSPVHLAAQSPMARALAAPAGKLLYWAELEVRDGRVQRILQSSRNADWGVGGSIDEGYFQAAVRRLNLADFKDNGVAILRVRQDPSRTAEWMGLAFPSGPSESSSVVFALVDPGEAFPVFKRFAGRSEGGNLRAYLVGSDGIVISHSQKPFIGSDFRGLPVFQQAVKEIFKGKRIGGTGQFLAIDRVMAMTGYSRVGSLPLAVVVERAGSNGLSYRFWQGLLVRGALFLSAVVAIILLSLLLVRRLVEGIARQRTELAGLARHAETEAEVKVPELPVTDPPVVEAIARLTRPLEALVPDSEREVRSPEVSLGQMAAVPVGATPRDFSELPWRQPAVSMESQLVESQFAAAGAPEAPKLPDFQTVSRELTRKVSGLLGLPALFFTYDAQSRLSRLLHAEGLPQELQNIEFERDLAFPIPDEVRTFVFETSRLGKIPMLTNYSPLARVVLDEFKEWRFQAWAVTGGQEGRRLSGVLVALRADGQRSDSQIRARYDSLNQAVRAAGERLAECAVATTTTQTDSRKDSKTRFTRPEFL